MQAPTLEGERVLLLEDEALIGLEVRDVLEREGASVSIAHNLPQALQYAVDPAFSAGVLDVQIGSGNAEPVCLALHRRRVPFIFFTGMGEQLSGRWAASPVVQKPARPEAIVGALKFVLLPETRSVFAEVQCREDHGINARIDHMIREGEERILLFRRGIALLASTGEDTSAAEALVATITESVDNLRAHRRMSAVAPGSLKSDRLGILAPFKLRAEQV